MGHGCGLTKESIIEKTYFSMNPPTQYCLPKPFVLSLSKYEWLNYLPFDRLRVNGFLSFTEEGRKNLIFSVYTIMDRLIYLSL